MTTDYRSSLALGGSDAAAMVKDFDAWIFKRRLIESGELPPWMLHEETSAMAFGTAVHMALLEPEKFNELKVVMPYVENFALKAGKTIKEEAQAKAREKQGFILRAEEHWAIENITANFIQEIDKNNLLLPKENEVEKEFFSEWKGLPLKGKIDWLAEQVIDLKTTRDISRVEMTMASEAYHVQLYHYQFISGRLVPPAIVWIENVAPFRVRYQPIGEETVAMAKCAWEMAMGRYAEEKSK